MRFASTVSCVKGGQLAAATSARVASVILSDVIGNDLGTIGSGPTAPDPTTFRDAWRNFGAIRGCPESSSFGASTPGGGHEEEPARNSQGRRVLFRRVDNLLIGDNRAAVDAVAKAAKGKRLQTLVLSTTVTGEARELAKFFGAMAREIALQGRPLARPCCVIAGGEPTVTIRGQGTGGRAQEFALAAHGDCRAF
jgi:glycerate 2-kinase